MHTLLIIFAINCLSQAKKKSWWFEMHDIESNNIYEARLCKTNYRTIMKNFKTQTILNDFNDMQINNHFILES